jgi:hypothetical protein
MNVKTLCVVGAAAGCAGIANAQLQSSTTGLEKGNAYVSPAGTTIYDNGYDGTSGSGFAAQIFEPAFEGYNVWLGDDFSADANYNNLQMACVGQLYNGGIDPFLVEDMFARIYDGLPNDPASTLVAEAMGGVAQFNGIDTWTKDFGDQACLPAGDLYYFAMAWQNNFGANGQIANSEQMGQGNDGFQWNPGGAFGFPGNLQFVTNPFDGVTPSAGNAVITGDQVEECDGGGCFADCDGNGELNILDFVCYQGLFQSGDPGADCDGNGELNILDFVCFQGAFQAGCP